MIGFLWRAAHFWWRSSGGYRLTPWRSPYLRWRIETYWGLEAGQLTSRDVRRFTWEHRGELLRFLRWADRMEASRRGQAGRTWAVAPDQYE